MAAVPPEGLPGEQTAGKSLLFDGPTRGELEILGHPVASGIRVAADHGCEVALRLCEVTRRQILAGQRPLGPEPRTEGHVNPVALRPGEAYDVTIELDLSRHRFKAGNRIRLAVSESLWPLSCGPCRKSQRSP